jgi:hypothetical protein
MALASLVVQERPRAGPRWTALASLVVLMALASLVVQERPRAGPR